MIAVNYIWKHSVFAYPKREHNCFNRIFFSLFIESNCSFEEKIKINVPILCSLFVFMVDTKIVIGRRGVRFVSFEFRAEFCPFVVNSPNLYLLLSLYYTGTLHIKRTNPALNSKSSNVGNRPRVLFPRAMAVFTFINSTIFSRWRRC
jgi:hypothetical protein